MPVVGRGNHHGLNIFVVKEPSKIFVTSGERAAGGKPLLEARLIDIAKTREIHIILAFEIANVLRANQAVSDEPNLYPIVCAEHPWHQRCHSHRTQKIASRG